MKFIQKDCFYRMREDLRDSEVKQLRACVFSTNFFSLQIGHQEENVLIVNHPARLLLVPIFLNRLDFHTASNNGSDFVALFIGFSLGLNCVGVLSDKLTNDTAGFLTDTGAVENRDQKCAFGGIGNDLESWAVFDLDFGVFVGTIL